MIQSTRGALLVLAGCLSAFPVPAQQQPAGPAPAASSGPSLLVLPIRDDPHDSIRTILQRDLEYGGRLTVVGRDPELLRPLVAGGNPPILSPDSVGQLGARFVLRATRSGERLQVTVFDTLNRTDETRSFDLLRVVYRGTELHDSLARAYELREGAARGRLVRLGALYDSLLQASRGRQPRNAEQRALVAAQRDSLFLAIAAEAPGLHALISRLPAERDSVIRERMNRELTAFDSLSYVQRMALHEIADELQLWLTGVRGGAASRIAFVRGGRLYVIDSDGANERALTRVGRALSPAWHPSGRWIVFSDITDAGTQIAEVEVGSGWIRMLGATPRGYNITPAYTPDGKHIVYAATGAGGSQLVSLERESQRVTRLGTGTRNASSPTFSPDGQRMAMVIPRAYAGSGAAARMTPQLFLASATGTGLEPLTPHRFGERTYRTSPEWSPDGRYVAYTQQGEGFQVWLIGVRDRRARQLTRGQNHEDPSWSPDSRHVVVTAGRDDTQLVVVDVETGHTRELTSKSDARLPTWSPRWTPEQPVVRPGERYTARDD